MATIEQIITDNIDVWSSAIQEKKGVGRGSSKNLNLYGIKNLRKLILELALQGLLIPQDSRDESAKVLLDKIAQEKVQLIKEGGSKKQKALPEINEDELPYVLPKGWEWVRLQQIIQISSGDGLTSKNMNDNGVIPVYGGNGVTGYHDRANTKKQTLVIGRVGYYCGSIHLTPVHAWVTDNAFKTTFSEDNIFIGFLCWLLKGTNLKKDESATAQPVISGRKIYPIVVGLPPKKEQHRIVTKINELMTLCDQLEQQQENNITAHKTLVETLLSALTNAADKGTFEQAWGMISNHFDTLFSTDHSIDQLKQVILQLAVTGKLVPQDPNDEPANNFYMKTMQLPKNYTRLNKQAIKGKNIISLDTLPNIPKNWVYKNVDNLYETNHILDYADGNHGSLYPRKEDFGEKGVLFLTAAQITNNGYIDWDNCPRLINEKAKLLTKGWSTSGDVFFTHNATVGRTAIAAGCPEKNFLLGTSVTYYRLNKKSIVLRYLYLYFSSASWYSQAASVMQQTTRNQVSITKQALFYIALPPIKEQQRIVQIVDKLMPLCDQLKSHINNAQITQLHLSDTLYEQSIN